MLPHYSPLKVAETFSMLSASSRSHRSGGRRAPGSDPLTAVCAATRPAHRAPDDFPSSSRSCCLSRGPMPPIIGSRVSPRFPAGRRARVWLLGSSPQSGDWAAELGLPTRSPTSSTRSGAAIAASYRQHFTRLPSARCPRRRGSSARTPTRKPSGSPRAAGWRSRCSCRGDSSRFRRSRPRSIFCRHPGERGRLWAAAAEPSSDHRTPVRAGIEALAADTARRGDDRDDHPRSCRAAP